MSLPPRQVADEATTIRRSRNVLYKNTLKSDKIQLTFLNKKYSISKE